MNRKLLPKDCVVKFFIVFLTLFCIPLFSQTSLKKIDSIQSLLKKSSENRNFENINTLADLYSDSDLKTAQKFANEAIKIAEKEDNDSHLALAYNSLGNILQYKSELDSSLIFIQKSLDLRKKEKDSLGMADSYNNIGIVYDQKADYPEALNNYFKALKIYEKKKDLAKQAMIASNIGVIYKAQKEYKKSLEYYFLAYRLYQKLKNDFGVAITTGNIGSTLINFKNYKEALSYSKMSENGYMKLGMDRFRGYPVSNMAIIYDSLKNYKLASENYTKAIQLHEKYENGVEVADNAKNFAKFLYHQKKYNESITYAKKALDFAEKSDAKLLINETQLILAKSYAAIGNLDLAYQYQLKHIQGKEKIFETEKTKSVFELEKKYQSEKKDKEILENKSKIFKRNVAVLSLLGLLILFAVYYRNYQHKQKIKLQKEIMHQQDIAAKAVMEAEDNERKRMAIHLHDGVGQLLTATNMNLQVLEELKDRPDVFDNVVNKTKNILNDAMTEVRTLSHQMMPNMLIKNSLSNALKELIDKTNSPKLHITLKLDGLQDNLDENLQIVMFRVIQESINNTLKHADASEVIINVTQSLNVIETKISDNGKGFNIHETPSKYQGMGLENMKSRIEFLKGKFSVNSEQGKGTQVFVKIPL